MKEEYTWASHIAHHLNGGGGVSLVFQVESAAPDCVLPVGF